MSCSGFHVFLSSLRLIFIDFIAFLCTGNRIVTFRPQKSILFWGGQSDSGAKVFAHESSFLKQSWWHQLGHICAKVLPARDMRKPLCFRDSQRLRDANVVGS